LTRPDNRGFLPLSQEANRLKALIALALLSNTCSQTTLTGSSKINVVPPTAKLELDCRLLPDEEPLQLLSELATIINDDNIKITNIMGFTPAISKTDTPLYDAIAQAATSNMEKAVLLPSVSTGLPTVTFFVMSASSALGSRLFCLLRVKQQAYMATTNAFLSKI